MKLLKLYLVWIALAALLAVGCEQGNVGSGAVAAPGAVAGSTSGSSDSGTGAPPTHPTSTDLSFQARVLELTNQFRAANGVAPLAANAQLAQAAQSYAELMAAQNWFDHNSPDGTTPGSRISATGYNWTTWGENIAEGYATPEDVVNGWINSPGHRANMLNAAFKELGVGHAKGTADYWVQDFGAQ